MDNFPLEKMIQNNKQLQEELSKVSEILKPAFEISAEISKNIKPILEAISQLSEPLEQISRTFSLYFIPFQKRQRVVKAFQECNLWLAPSMIELCDKITELYYDGKKEIIPDIILSYYQENEWNKLKNTVSHWEQNSFFQPRMFILYDALEAHINGKYTLSIPTLLPHIEGIALDIVKKYNLPELKKPLIYDDKSGAVTQPSRIFAEVAINAFTFEEWVAVESLLYYLEKTLYFSKSSKRKGLENLKQESDLKRNPILHGIQINYASKMNSLRCFLALDVISLINDQDENRK